MAWAMAVYDCVWMSYHCIAQRLDEHIGSGKTLPPPLKVKPAWQLGGVEDKSV
jgi:hypothetical protein